ncbi:MAG: flagellar basal body P-ring formation chaperone FlgA [Bdellovibrionales bacterium]
MNRTTRILFTTWLILSGSVGSPTPCVADASVTLKPDVEITSPTVKLSDLFAGVPSEIDRDIAQAPLPCKPALYDEVVLRKLANTYRLDWQSQKSANQITVSSVCTRLSSDSIGDAVIEKLHSTVGAKRLKFEVVFDKRDMTIELPMSELPSFSLENFSYDPTSKKFKTNLAFQTPRGSYSLPVAGRVLVKRSVPVLARRLEAGSIIGSSDLDWLEVPEERVSAEVVTEPDQILGRELRRDMSDGELLRSRDTAPLRLVQRGSLVTIKIETPFILITTQGKAQQDGVEGETIRVINMQSNRIVEGIVTAHGVVEIRPARKIAMAE